MVLQNCVGLANVLNLEDISRCQNVCQQRRYSFPSAAAASLKAPNYAQVITSQLNKRRRPGDLCTCWKIWFCLRVETQNLATPKFADNVGQTLFFVGRIYYEGFSRKHKPRKARHILLFQAWVRKLCRHRHMHMCQTALPRRQKTHIPQSPPCAHDCNINNNPIHFWRTWCRESLERAVAATTLQTILFRQKLRRQKRKGTKSQLQSRWKKIPCTKELQSDTALCKLAEACPAPLLKDNQAADSKERHGDSAQSKRNDNLIAYCLGALPF